MDKFTEAQTTERMRNAWVVGDKKEKDYTQ
jgi:hypothetical protein